MQSARPGLHRAARCVHAPFRQRYVSTQSRREGDISSVFASLSGGSLAPLPPRFAEIKRQLIAGHENKISQSWESLLSELAKETALVAKLGSDIIPQIDFRDLQKASPDFIDSVRARGAAVIRQVVPKTEARAYKDEVEEYIKLNPWTRAFPQHDPQVYELYWSRPQVRARAHENLLATQRFLMSLWRVEDPSVPISVSQPLTYADRIRIRQPGDAGFALGPHVDGGGVERWEPDGYGRGHVYDKIWQGDWQAYDPWEAGCRVPVATDLYSGAGACSMFRMFQGWLGLSNTGPNEGTLKVNPLLKLSTAYFLLRPFFKAKTAPDCLVSGQYTPEFLDADNWELVPADEMSADIQGANPGHAQELNQVLHPHLHLDQTMVHIPKIEPGDFVVWHCDSIHSVDKVHQGKTDSSVMYIPVCPVTEGNVDYMVRQRQAFVEGLPGPDFPGGKGESEHSGRPTVAYLRQYLGNAGLSSMGFAKVPDAGPHLAAGEREALSNMNTVLGFS